MGVERSAKLRGRKVGLALGSGVKKSQSVELTTLIIYSIIIIANELH